MSNVPAFLIYAIYRVDEKDVEAYKSLANRMASSAKMHSGCLFLDVLQDVNDPSTFRLVRRLARSGIAGRASPQHYLQ